MIRAELDNSSYGDLRYQPQHKAMLQASAVAADVANERGYMSITDRSQISRAYFSDSQTRQIPGLLIPLWNVYGENAGYQYRPDNPRIVGGQSIKYETRKEQSNVIDAHPRIQPHLDDPGIDLWITEGSKKADSAISAGLCCIALTGVWNWRGTNKKGGKLALADWNGIALEGRRIILAFDSDYMSNVNVWNALKSLSDFLRSKKADVHFAHLPDEQDDKTGLDDYIAAHGQQAIEELVIDREIGAKPIVPIDVPVACDGLNRTDVGNAERLLKAHGSELHYIAKWKQWIAWDGTRWKPDPGDVVVSGKAKSIARNLWRQIADLPPNDSTRNDSLKWAKQSESAQSISNAVRLARDLPGIAIEHDELDADPWMLNVKNGIVDLRTGEFREHDPDALHSLIAGTWWDENATAPRWEAFLETVLPDPETRAYFQRAVGYTATGHVVEQVLFILLGLGSNGKSTAAEAIRKALGEYAGPIAKDLMIAQRHEAHPTSTADLFRLRFAVAQETEAKDSFAEAQVKRLTGGEQLTARRMNQDFWSFDPSHKLWLAANYLPKIVGTDHGTWRRIMVIPWNIQIGEADRDPNLPYALADELPGILRWIVEGCLAWREQGLNPPKEVTEAIGRYRSDSDWLEQFLADSAWEIADGMSTSAGALNEAFRTWCAMNGEDIPKKALHRELEQKGCRQNRDRSTRRWMGIGKIQEFQSHGNPAA